MIGTKTSNSNRQDVPFNVLNSSMTSSVSTVTDVQLALSGMFFNNLISVYKSSLEISNGSYVYEVSSPIIYYTTYLYMKIS